MAPYLPNRSYRSEPVMLKLLRVSGKDDRENRDDALNVQIFNAARLAFAIV